MLKYEVGQFYHEHHDQNAPKNSAWGPRLYTFFMYLNDVEAGGETRFTRLNISVTPRKGSAILWPSVRVRIRGGEGNVEGVVSGRRRE